MKSKQAIEEVLLTYPGWKLMEKGMEKTFVFESFDKAIQRMQELVPEINRVNHHPDWENSFNKVRVRLFTHDEGAVTEKDINLLVLIEQHWSKS